MPRNILFFASKITNPEEKTKDKPWRYFKGERFFLLNKIIDGAERRNKRALAGRGLFENMEIFSKKIYS